MWRPRGFGARLLRDDAPQTLPTRHTHRIAHTLTTQYQSNQNTHTQAGDGLVAVVNREKQGFPQQTPLRWLRRQTTNYRSEGVSTLQDVLSSFNALLKIFLILSLRC